MKLERVEIENYRAIEKLDLPLDPALTVFHGANGHGKTSVLGAIAAGLGSIPALLPEVSGVGFLKTDRRGPRPLRVKLRTRDGIEWERRLLGGRRRAGLGVRPGSGRSRRRWKPSSRRIGRKRNRATFPSSPSTTRTGRPSTCRIRAGTSRWSSHATRRWRERSPPAPKRVLVDLRRTFPNTQFIASTHSPQVLTTVRPEHIVELRREDGRIVAGRPSAPTFGAEAGDVLFTVMKVDERPDNEFKTTLDDYMRFVEDGQGECEEAASLGSRLVELSPDASGIHGADIEIERRKLLNAMAESR